MLLGGLTVGLASACGGAHVPYPMRVPELTMTPREYRVNGERYICLRWTDHAMLTRELKACCRATGNTDCADD